MKSRLRNWFRFLIRDELATKLNPIEKSNESSSDCLTQIAQKQLIAAWKQQLASGQPLSLRDVGFRCKSQFEEDGILLYIMTALGISRGTFVDIGSDDGINSNCANLAVYHGWDGLFIDGNPNSIERGKKFYDAHANTWAFPPRFKQAMVTRENVNELVSGMPSEVDLLSIDIDGNDYWVWEALTEVTPTVVIVETHVEFGMRSIAVPYNKDYVYPGKHPDYHGASVVALAKLARSKGYRLVGSNSYGFNTIYIRNGLGEELFPEVSPESVLAHPRNEIRAARFEEIKDWDYVTI